MIDSEEVECTRQPFVSSRSALPAFFVTNIFEIFRDEKELITEVRGRILTKRNDDFLAKEAMTFNQRKR